MCTYNYSHLPFSKRKENQNKQKSCTLGKTQHLPQEVWENWMSIHRRIKSKPYLPLCTKIISKCNKDLNLNSETLKFLEETTHSTLQSTGVGKVFLCWTLFAQELKPTIDS